MKTPTPQTIAVTGPLGYSGRAITRRLLDAGHTVRGLTNSGHRANPFGPALTLAPLGRWDETDLARSLAGCDALINTYWVRFDHRDFNHAEAVENSRRLFAAARRAGVRRIVHVSITNPDAASPLPYFHGKAEVEAALERTGVDHTILRPAVLFGDAPGEDILVNNMAWALRRLPVIGVFGDGSYRLQPIHIDDFARLAERALDPATPRLVQAIGPETFSFRGLFETLGHAIGRPRPILDVSPALGYAVAKLVGAWHHDVFLTREEIRGLMEDRLCVDGAPPAGTTKLSEWAARHRDTLGRRYASELARRRR